MSKLIDFSKSVTFKFYLVIIAASLMVTLLGVNIFTDAKAQITRLSNAGKIAATQNILKIFSSWLDERTRSLQNLSDILQIADATDDEAKLGQILAEFRKNSDAYDAVQFLKENGEIFVNGKKIARSNAENFDRKELIWYVETKNELKPTINYMPRHVILGEPTINVCVPSFTAQKFAGALCGVVRLSKIFQNIRNFDLPEGGYAFIVTHGGEILTPLSEPLKTKIQSKFQELLLQADDIKGFKIGGDFVSIAQIPTLNWFVGAGADDSNEQEGLLRIFRFNGALLLFSFAALVIIANFLHNLMYRRAKAKSDEYEILLAHRAKMSEAGELIGGISHQFIQPVNSLNLMISTLRALQEEGNLSKEDLREILKSGENSVKLLSDTIEIFRNFYKAGEDAREFSVKQSLHNLLTLMHTELARANVSVIVGDFTDGLARQKENIVQQILLILLHNAKDALIEKFSDAKERKIYVGVKFEGKFCFISVQDNGGGVDKATQKKIFAQPKTTKKSGNGIGLYFGKKLAKEKLGGDLRLIKASGPTTFELSFTYE